MQLRGMAHDRQIGDLTIDVITQTAPTPTAWAHILRIQDTAEQMCPVVGVDRGIDDRGTEFDGAAKNLGKSARHCVMGPVGVQMSE